MHDRYFCTTFSLEGIYKQKPRCDKKIKPYQIGIMLGVDIILNKIKYSELDSFGSSTVPGHFHINIFVFPECQSIPIY